MNFHQMAFNRARCAFVTGLVLLLFLAPTCFADNSSGRAATIYPVILVHGMFASAEIGDTWEYWYGLEDVLRKEGAEVYITSVNGMDSTEAKAADFKRQFLEILAISGKSKANIIGHSHGTVYTRYAISNLGLGDMVASHTSIAGPHRGSAVADVIVGLIPDPMELLVGNIIDYFYTLFMGDKNPDSLQNAYDMTRPYMINTFNPNTPDVEGVYYQSWTGILKEKAIKIGHFPFGITWRILMENEGQNDGLVSVDSSKWGNFRGVETGAWYSAGVDHYNLVGQPNGKPPGFDRDQFYLNIVNELKEMGF